jgi:hypothetical protein
MSFLEGGFYLVLRKCLNSVAKLGLKLSILLYQPPKGWDSRNLHT